MPGARRRVVIGHLLPTPLCFVAGFVLGQEGELFGREWQPVWELGWEWVGGAGRAGRGQAHGLSQASRQLRFWDPGLGAALRQPGPKLLSRWPSVHGARSPGSMSAGPLRASETRSTPRGIPNGARFTVILYYGKQSPGAGSLRKGERLVRG